MRTLRFKVGDRARIVDRRCKHYKSECTILEILDGPKPYFVGAKFGGNKYRIDYLISVPNTTLPIGPTGVPGWGIADYSLEPILDFKQELGSWEEIKNITGWNPTKNTLIK